MKNADLYYTGGSNFMAAGQQHPPIRFELFWVFPVLFGVSSI